MALIKSTLAVLSMAALGVNGVNVEDVAKQAKEMEEKQKKFLESDAYKKWEEADKKLFKEMEEFGKIDKDNKNIPGMVLWSKYESESKSIVKEKLSKAFESKFLEDKKLKLKASDYKKVKVELNDDDKEAIEKFCMTVKDVANSQMKEDKQVKEADKLKCTDAELKVVKKQLSGWLQFAHAEKVREMEYVQKQKAAYAKALGKSEKDFEALQEAALKGDVEKLAELATIAFKNSDKVQKLQLEQNKTVTQEKQADFDRTKKFVAAYKKIDFTKFDDLSKAFAAQNKVVSAHTPSHGWGFWWTALFVILGLALIAGVVFLVMSFMKGGSKGGDEQTRIVAPTQSSQYNSV